MINSDTWWPFGKITGCFPRVSSVKFLRRSLTQSSPLQCTKGPSCNKLECLGSDLFLSSKDNAISSAEKNFFLYCLDYILASLFKLSCRLRRPRDDWLVWGPWFVSLNFLMNTIRLTIARLREDQQEKRLNLSQLRLWGECVDLAQVMTSLFTSGFLLLRHTSRSEAWGWSSGFHRN